MSGSAAVLGATVISLTGTGPAIAGRAFEAIASITCESVAPHP